MTCPHCGAAVEPGERFCGNCGQEVTSAAPTTSFADESTRNIDATQPAPGAYTPPSPYSTPQQPGYSASGQHYNQPQGGTAYVPSPPAYQRGNAPQAGNPAVMWIGVTLIIVGVAAGICFTALAMFGATQPDYDGQAGDALLGSLICSIGLLIVFGVPGAIMFFLGRRK